MGKMRLTLDVLKDLDMGKVAAGFQKEVAHVVADCMDRPSDDRARKVGLIMSVVPDCDGMGVCETATVEFKIQSSVPARQSKTYQMRVHANGSLLFNPESPDNVHQGTLDEMLAPEEGEAKKAKSKK
jgi:hypothetical protein